MNYTDDARLVDQNWNHRHHVTPSGFNGQNHRHYKVSQLIILLYSNTKLEFDGLSNTSIKISRTSRVSCWTLSASLTHMKRTMWRERVCPTTLSCQRKETFMVSLAGSATSTSRTRRIMERCMGQTVSSSTALRTITSSLITLLSPTKNSSAKMHQKDLLLNCLAVMEVWARSTLQWVSNPSNRSQRCKHLKEVALSSPTLNSRAAT